MSRRRSGATGVQPRWRTSIAGGAVIVPATKRRVEEHVAAAVRSAEAGETAWVRALDRPDQVVRFTMTEQRTLLVTAYMAGVPVFKSDPRAVWPAWFDDVLQIVERLSAVPYERSLLNG